MPSVLLDHLEKKGLIHPPSWLTERTTYLTVMGSVAYGVSTEVSDLDVYGFCVPPKEVCFPWLKGKIPGFDKDLVEFEQWTEHGIKEGTTVHDFQVFSVARYFSLLLDNNPNVLDSVFTPDECVLQGSKVASIVRENRKIFLHKGAFHRFRGYAHSQLMKMKNKVPPKGSKREANTEKFGFDVKYASHVIRLCEECKQILTEGDLNLRRSAETQKAIRRGEWTEEQVEKWFAEKEAELELLYGTTTLPWTADKDEVRELLMRCLEEEFGNLDKIMGR